MTGDPTKLASKIIVIADDLSGAAELAGIAFARGLSAEVQRQFELVSDAQLIAIDTDSRSLPSAAAAERVRKIAEQVLGSQRAWTFKKVDSVLRGNVRAEIEAVLKVTGHARAVLIPANPSRGRTITGGQYFIDGAPIHQTAFAHDPDHPRRSPDVRSLLEQSGDFAVHTIAADSPLPADGLIVPDAATAADVLQRAHTIDSTTLAAGAADFFAALLEERCTLARWGRESISESAYPIALTSAEIDSRPLPLTPPALLVCGSRAVWHERCQSCLAADVPVTAIDQEWTQDFSSSALLIGIGELSATSSSELLRRLADRAASIIEDMRPKTILVEGGATATALAQRHGWTRFAIAASAPAGVGVLQPLAANAPLMLVKPGSYPWPADIWEAFCRCRVA